MAIDTLRETMRLIRDGEVSRESVLELAFFVTNEVAGYAIEASQPTYGDEVSKRISKEMSWADLNKISITAMFEVFKRMALLKSTSTKAQVFEFRTAKKRKDSVPKAALKQHPNAIASESAPAAQ